MQDYAAFALLPFILPCAQRCFINCDSLPAGNPRLRTAIDAAKAASMPKENIERAIKKGTGELEGVHYVEVTYEGYGPGGVAILISALSDNPTRTVAEIRHKLTRLGGNLGPPNSVSYLFDRKGQIYIDASKYDEDMVLEVALDGGAEDFRAEGEQYIVTTDPHGMHTVEDAIGQAVALAKYPNVSVKLSASPGISREPYPFRDVAGHLKRVFDAYGPQRCYWGTDMTNSFAKATYRQRITHFTEELSFLSEDDKDWIMGRAILERLKWA